VNTTFEGIPSEHEGKLRFDHGCQFFRADTPLFGGMVKNWLEKGWIREWKGPFLRPLLES